MNKFERAASTLLPLAGFMHQLTKEETILAPAELIVLKSAITVIAAGYLLHAEALRRRQMEAAHTRDKRLSKAGMALITAGVGAALYALWKIKPF